MRRDCGSAASGRAGAQLRAHGVANAYSPAVGLNHLPDQFLEADARTPSKSFPCFRSIPQEQVDLGRPEQGRVVSHVIAIVQSHAGEGRVRELADRMRLSRRDDIIIRFRLLKH